MADAPDPHAAPSSTPQLAIWTLLGGAFLLALVLFSIRLQHNPDSSRDYPSRTLPPDQEPVLLAHEVSSDFFPCSDCHEGEDINRKVRKLEEEHDDLVLKHGDLWCFHCHDAEERDRLHLADGTRIEFPELWRLCTQCHAHRLLEWQSGVHGKRTGHWWGEKGFRTCVVCHNPHAPLFQPLQPLPPPLPPTEIASGYAGPVEVPLDPKN